MIVVRLTSGAASGYFSVIRAGARPYGGIMSNVVVKSPMQYLDKAVMSLRDLGIMPPKAEDAPILGLLQRISDLDENRIAVIARTLAQTAVFNEVVREQTQAVEIGERYRQIAEGF